MTTSTTNWPLIDSVLDQIDAHPETWDQNHWRCGTSMCFAGWTVELSQKNGVKWVQEDPNEDSIAVTQVIMPGAFGRTEEVHVSTAACDLLGLPSAGANALFEGTNSREDISYVLQAIEAGEYDELTCEACGDTWTRRDYDHCPSSHLHDEDEDDEEFDDSEL
jgi:hypothetical protein